jgi:predicted negative regulator of RcsB-dependent stress response
MEETSEKSKIMALLERNWKWLVVSGLVVLGGSLGFRMLRTNHEELHRVNRLREKIELALEKAEDSLCPLTI